MWVECTGEEIVSTCVGTGSVEAGEDGVPVKARVTVVTRSGVPGVTDGETREPVAGASVAAVVFSGVSGAGNGSVSVATTAPTVPVTSNMGGSSGAREADAGTVGVKL